MATNTNRRTTLLFTNVGADLYGADYVLLCLVRSLSPEKFRSIVIVPYDGPLVSELKAACAKVIVREFPVLRRSVFSPLGILRFTWQMVESLLFLIRLAQKENVTIFHTNTASIWIPGIVARLLRKPHIWQVMELIESPRFVRVAMNKMTGIFSTRVFCISDAVRHHFLADNHGREYKFQTLYHGVDLHEYNPNEITGVSIRQQLGLPEDAIMVLYAGRFSPWKGQDVLAEAARIICSDTTIYNRQIHFVFVGSCFSGNEHCKTNLTEQLQRLPDPRRAHLYGFQRNLPEWMAASDIFVLPSKRPEPNATVLIAAMAMRLPCIGTNIGGTVETIKDHETGLLISPDDPKRLAAAINILAANKTKRQMMGEAGRERALAQFSLEKYCRIITSYYEKPSLESWQDESHKNRLSHP